MPRFLKPALVLAAVAAVCFLISFKISGTEAYLAVGFASAASSIVFFIMAAVTAVQRKLGKTESSPWKLFAVETSLLIAAAVAIGLTDKGDHPENLGDGWLGALLLYYTVPILVGLLIFELLIWNIRKSFIEAKGEDAPAATAQTQNKRPVRITVEERPAPQKPANDFSEPPAEAFSLGALPPPDGSGSKK